MCVRALYHDFSKSAFEKLISVCLIVYLKSLSDKQVYLQKKFETFVRGPTLELLLEIAEGSGLKQSAFTELACQFCSNY